MNAILDQHLSSIKQTEEDHENKSLRSVIRNIRTPFDPVQRNDSNGALLTYSTIPAKED